MRHATTTLAALVPLAFSSCQCDEQLSQVRPKIAVLNAVDPTAVSICQTEFVRDCAFDFGSVETDRARVLTFVIQSTGQIGLRIHSVAFEDGSDPAFTLDSQPPARVDASTPDGVPVFVKYKPRAESSGRARLLIHSDASNVALGEPVVIELTGTGISRAGPDIEITPPRCDFGNVGVGATAFCDLSVANTGQRELLLTEIAFSAETPFPAVFGTGSTPGSPTSIPTPTAVLPGTAISVRLYARPSSSAAAEGALLVSSTDQDEPAVSVPLVVSGAETPTAVARVLAINGVPNAEPSPTVEPLDDVELSADQSSPSRPGGSIQGWEWSIVSKPVESNVILSSPTTATTRLVFNSSGNNAFGLDVAGTYVVRLTVTDDLGSTSQNDARVSLNAIPGDGLHVQLTWDVATGDIDTHVTRNGTSWCSDNDCCFRNCRGGLDWGGNGQDPHLDIDDTSGFGPENVNIDTPSDGQYTVAASYFNAAEPTHVTIRVFVSGSLEGEYIHRMTQTGDLWIPVRVDISGGGVELIELDQTRFPVGGEAGPMQEQCLSAYSDNTF